MNIRYSNKIKNRISIRESVVDKVGLESTLYKKLSNVIYNNINWAFDITLFDETSYEETFVDGWDLFYDDPEEALSANRNIGQLVLVSISKELPAKKLADEFFSTNRSIISITYREYNNWLYILGYLR